MKKSLIVVCSCLVIAVVAVCILLGNLNGQKENSGPSGTAWTVDRTAGIGLGEKGR